MSFGKTKSRWFAIKIAFVSELGLPYVGGGQRYIQHLGRELVKLDFDVHWLYSKQQNAKKEEIIDGIKCHRINLPFGRIQTFSPFTFASILPVYKLAKKVDLLQFDVYFAGIAGWLPSKLARKPHLLMVYEFFRDLWDTMEKNRIKAWMYKLLEKYLANSPYPLFLTISEYTKRCLVNLGCDENSVKVVYLGVDHDLFYPGYRQTFRKKYKLDNKFILGWTGRMNLSQSKNLPMLLRAFKIVKEQVPNTVLAFDGPDFRKLEPVVNEMGLKIGKDVFYNGCISRDELPTFYSSIDLYTCSSLSEGFGLSVVEAEACGKPVVCFDAGSLPEVVKDRKTGIVVREKNGRAMADAIITLLTDEGKRKKYGDAAAEWAKTFDWEKTAKETVDIYKELIGKYKR